jgi:uncharacterized membrane protein
VHPKELNRGELIAVVGSTVLVVSLFLHWYDLGNMHATLGSCRGPHTACTAWQALKIGRFLFIAAAAAPVILAYIILRGHGLSWPRGELTAVTSVAVIIMVIFLGVLDKPGTPRGEITVSYGWWLALAGGILILIGAVWRTSESTAARKPPGVL